jgi:hypothetical protein
MRHEAFYLIRASADLEDRLGRDGGELASLLREPVLWQKDEPDRSPWGQRDHIAKVKLLFLANLVVEYGGITELRELLGDGSLSIAAFDRWWRLERYSLDETCDDVEQRIPPQLARSLEETGIPLVDDWLRELRRR